MTRLSAAIHGRTDADTWIYIPGREPAIPAIDSCACVTVEGFSWYADLTPWPAPPLKRGGEPFSGQAEALLAELAELAAGMEKGFCVRRRCIAGCSLAGLFALWAVTRTELFDAAASVSGSVWYDGFTEYLRTAPIYAGRVYLSLGDREARARNPRMARVGECTEQVCAILESRGIPHRFVSEQGGHFDGGEARMLRACSFLAEP